MNRVDRPLGKAWTVLLVILLVVGLLTPRLADIGQYSVADEGHWLLFSANFYYALSTGDFAHTYQREHPGVLPMWAGTASFLLNYPGYRGIGPGYPGSIEEIEAILKEHGQSPLKLLNTAKSFMAVFNVLALVLAFWMLKKLVRLWPALGTVLLIGWDPFYLALSRLLHLDGLLSSLVMLSVVAFWVYLKEGSRLPLLLSAAAAAGAFLTKVPAVVLLPYIGLLALIDHLQHRRERKWWTGFWRPLLTWGLVMGAVVFILWPAMWVTPLRTAQEMYKGATGFALDSRQIIFFNGEIIPAAEAGWGYYPLSFLWRTTTMVLAGLVLAIPAYWRRWGIFKEPNVRRLVWSALLFVLIFYIFMQIGENRFDRYILPAMLFLDLVAGLGWAAAVGALAERMKSDYYIPVLLLEVVLVQLYMTIHVFPYPLSYYNPLLGGPKKAVHVMNIGWGEGYDLAADTLNQKPDADQLVAMASMGHGSFSFYFDGQAEWMDLSKFAEVDYVVIYLEHLQRCVPEVWCRVLVNMKPETVIKIGGIPYAWIFNQHEISPEIRQQILQAGTD
jgi:hypothetical protein